MKKHKEELISPYNGSGYVDLTAYCAIKNIVDKEKKELQEEEKQRKNHNKRANKC